MVRVEEFDTEAVICIERSEGDDGAASIDYTTVDGTALDGTNYTVTAGTLNWAAGETGQKCFTIPLLDDDIATPVAFTVEFSSPVGATGTPADVTVTINPTPA